jgi:hypothetical protein
MVRPHRRGNRLLHLPGLSANPRLPRTRACGYSGSNPASNLALLFGRVTVCAAITCLFPMFVIPLRVPFYLLLVSHCLTRPSSIRLLLMSLGLFVLRGVHLSVSYVRHHVARPFLSPTCESLCCASFVCLSCAHFCLVVHRGRRGEEWVSDSLASWEDKRMDVVASSWRYFSTQSIISLHRPIILPSVKRRCDHSDPDDHAEREHRTQRNRRPTNSETRTQEPATNAPGRIISGDPRTRTEPATNAPGRISIGGDPRTRTASAETHAPAQHRRRPTYPH